MEEHTSINRHAKIIVAGDSLEKLQLLIDALKSQDYRVFVVSDGQAVLDFARSIQPDLIILGFCLTRMDGFEICKQLKLDDKIQDVPVIFISSSDWQIDIDRCYSSGGVEVFIEPFDPQEVLSSIQTNLTIRKPKTRLEDQSNQLQQEFPARIQMEQTLKRPDTKLDNGIGGQAELANNNKTVSFDKDVKSRDNEGLQTHQLTSETSFNQAREQERQMREIIDAVPDAVLLLDETGLVIQHNSVTMSSPYSSMGIREGERLTHIGSTDLSDLLQSPKTSLTHEVTAGNRIFEVITRPTTSEEENQRWVLVIRDVTFEREIRNRAQQQERLAAVGQFASGIAHDFNNILAVILLYTEMSLGSSDLSPQQQERMLTISRQSKRAAELIQQILDFSRRTTLEKQPVDLLPFLKEQVKLLRRTMPENIQIELSYTAGPYISNTDTTRMQQAIMNLAVNSRDAMPDGGKLSIQLERRKPGDSIKCVTCGDVEVGNWIGINFSDSGRGIPMDVIPHIFEPFFTTKDAGQGTGLGLSQVIGIIENHEGHIRVRSSIGQGSTFELFLPALSQTQVDEYETDPRMFIRGRGQTILVAEDDLLTRQALIESLTLLNYKVLSTSDGTEALKVWQVQAQNVDLILSDVVMPEMGGIALMHAIREEGSQVPIILMTGHSLQGELETMVKTGLTAWLPKPPRLKQLAKIISETLTGTKIKPIT